MEDLFNVNPKISTAIFALIGYIILDDLTSNEQNVIGNGLMLTAQVLITNAASQMLIENRAAGSTININDKNFKNNYNPVIYDIEYLKEIFSKADNYTIETIVDTINNKIKIIEKTLQELKNK